MDGIIVINKPYGATSHQAVQLIRKLFPGVKAGHSGTLDPAATGVLPVCLGRATRITEYIVELPKTYRAAVTLGFTTDTEDAAGRIIEKRPVPAMDRARVEKILEKFRGKIEQVPPIYSAIKHRGKPLYYWARRGEEVPRRERRVEIYALELLEYNPEREPQLLIDVQCSKGTYMRTLAADLGKTIGCGAHLATLVRTNVGPFNLEEAFAPERAAEMANEGRYDELVRPMDSAMPHMPEVILPAGLIRALKNGQIVEPAQSELPVSAIHGSLVKIYDPDNNFKAVARLELSEEKAGLRTVKFLSA